MYYYWRKYSSYAAINYKNYNGDKTRGLCERLHIRLLQQSNIGKAITASISSSIVILVFMYIMDLQYGGVNNVLSDVMQSFSGIAGIIIVLMGIYFIVKSITIKRKSKGVKYEWTKTYAHNK